MADLNWNDFLGGVASGGLTVNSVGSTLPQNYTPYAPTPQGFTAYAKDQYVGWDPESAQQDWNAKQNTGQPTQQPSGQPSQPSEYDRIRSEYINQLNSNYGEMEAGLEPQRTAQENIVANNYAQGVSGIDVQQEQGMADLASQERKTEGNKKKTLQDLADNIRNLFMAGNVYLGAKGAGDSSAANMYSYALNKIGNKQRGDIVSQTASIINDIREREAKLRTTVIQAKKELETEKNNQLQNIAQWFSEAQNQIRQMKGQDLAQLSNTLLQNAMNKLNTIDTDYRNKYNMLTEWAANNSTTIEGLKQKIAQIPGVLGNLPTASNMTVGSVGMTGGQNYSAPVGMGYSNEEKKF